MRILKGQKHKLLAQVFLKYVLPMCKKAKIMSCKSKKWFLSFLKVLATSVCTEMTQNVQTVLIVIAPIFKVFHAVKCPSLQRSSIFLLVSVMILGWQVFIVTLIRRCHSEPSSCQQEDIFFDFSVLFIQHCFIGRPSDPLCRRMLRSNPGTVVTSALAVRRSNHSGFTYFLLKFVITIVLPTRGKACT